MTTARFVDGENVLELIPEGGEFAKITIQYEGRLYSFDVTLDSEEFVPELQQVLANFKRNKNVQKFCKNFPVCEFYEMDINDVDEKFRNVLAQFPEDTDILVSTRVMEPDVNGRIMLELKILFVTDDHLERSVEYDEVPEVLRATYSLTSDHLKTWAEALLAACQD